MASEQQDDLDFDSMLDDCASGLDTKIVAQTPAEPKPSQTVTD